MFFRDKSPQQIQERLAQLATDLAQTKAAIREAEGRAAQALAEGSADGADFGALANLKAQEAAMQGARVILETELVTAGRRERLASAKSKRDLAQQKRSEAAGLAIKCAKLLEKLGEIEGVVYDGSILCAQRGGSWMRDLRIGERIPDTLRSPLEAGAPDFSRGWYEVPRSRLLIDQAIVLEDQAEEIQTDEGLAVEPSAEPEPASRG
jgi:hypothetical protein